MKEIEIPIRFPIRMVGIRGKNPNIPSACAHFILKMNTRLPLFISCLYLAYKIVILATKNLMGIK
jgi:hypothetical protein